MTQIILSLTAAINQSELIITESCIINDDDNVSGDEDVQTGNVT